ncbi:MAG: exodeoxyribonuclease VII large subunit, partial [bacterium]
VLQQRAAEMRSRLAVAQAAPFLRQPEQVAERLAQRVDTVGMRLDHAVRQRVQEERQRAEQAVSRLRLLRERRVRQVEARVVLDERRLTQAGRLQVERLRARLTGLERQMGSLSPLAVLDRGYSLTRTAEGRLVRSVAEAAPGVKLVTQVKDGRIESVVGGSSGNPAG